MQVAREIELQASLQHPSIVQIYAAFEDSEGIYVVQEYALGGDLYAQLAQAGGYLGEDQVAGEVLVPVLAALRFMHDKVRHHEYQSCSMCKAGSAVLALAALDFNYRKIPKCGSQSVKDSLQSMLRCAVLVPFWLLMVSCMMR